MKEYAPLVTSVVHPLQMGLGGAKNGMAAAVMAARSWTKNVHSSGAHMAILKIDIKNAYNTINRGEVLSNVKEFCPQIYNLCAWRLGGSANIFWNGQRIESTCDIVQGDPLAPLMFVLGIHKIAMQLDLIPDLHQIWYLDDCLIFGDESSLKLALTKLQDSLKLLGLALNYCKCELYMTESHSVHLDQIPTVTDCSKWSYLGAALTDEIAAVHQDALARTQMVTQKIRDIAGTTTRPAALRLCAGTCRIEHLLRLTTLKETADFLIHPVSKGLNSVLSEILQVSSLSPQTWAHATLPVRMGGSAGALGPVIVCCSGQVGCRIR